MKKIFLLLPFLILVSCSVQKRKYKDGYYISWNHKKSVPEKEHTKKQEPLVKEEKKEVTEEIRVSTGDKRTVMAEARHTLDQLKIKVPFFNAGEDSCDVLIFKDGSEVSAKVEEVGINEIKYKRCDSKDGPLYVTRKSDVFMIKYKNGTKEVIKSSEPAVNPVAPAKQSSYETYKSNKRHRENHPLALPALILGSLSVAVGYILGIYMLTLFALSPIVAIPIILGIIAVALGITALNRIKEQPDVYKGKGMAMPGFIMGLVIACIYAMIIFMYLLFGM